MKTHKMKLATVPFEKIVSGKKVIETRLYDEKRQQINLNDKIEFSSVEDTSKKVLTIVKALYRYPDFQSLFAGFSPELFGGESKEQLLEEIETYYSKEDQQKFGVLGIRIETIS